MSILRHLRMTSHTRATLLAALLALLTSAMYLWRLDDTPIYLTRPEAFVGLTGQALAAMRTIPD